MQPIKNKGSASPYRTGAVYLLVEEGGRWRLQNRRGDRFTARGLFNFVRLASTGEFLASKTGEHVHISRGQDVWYAGQIRFGYNRATRGRIKMWSNGSGHYRPPDDLAYQARLPLHLFNAVPST